MVHCFWDIYHPVGGIERLMNKQEILQKAIKLAEELELLQENLSVALENKDDEQIIKILKKMQINSDKSHKVLKDFVKLNKKIS